MESERQPGILKPEALPANASDMETAFFLVKHIDKPCEVETFPGQTGNLRDFYIREAERLLPGMDNQGAKRFLELKIAEYKNN